MQKKFENAKKSLRMPEKNMECRKKFENAGKSFQIERAGRWSVK